MGLEGLRAVTRRAHAIRSALSGGRAETGAKGAPTMLIATCHCDAVRIEVDLAPADLNQCHCSICRRYETL